jgi:hypothetical protein
MGNNRERQENVKKQKQAKARGKQQKKIYAQRKSALSDFCNPDNIGSGYYPIRPRVHMGYRHKQPN